MGQEQVSCGIRPGALVATIVVSVTATFGLSTRSAAAPLPSNASSDVTVACLGQSDRIFAEMALNLGCDRATTSSQGVGQALTTFSDYPGPVADVQASYQGTSSVFHSGTSQGVNTYAEVAFDAAVQSIKDSPVPVSEVPVTIVAPYSMNVSATIADGWSPTSIHASAAVGLWAPAVDLVEKSTSVDVYAGDSAVLEGSLIVSGMFQTGESNTVTIRIRSGCFAGGSGSFSIPGSAECQSIIDPIFLFDQDLFDGIMGEDTFALADYFELGLSGNVAQPVVPEPSTFSLLALGLVALSLLGRSERRWHAAGWIRRARLA